MDLAALLADLAADLAISLGLSCRAEVEPVTVPAAIATHLVIMVNELVVNAHKHAFGARGEGGAVTIGGGPAGPGMLRIEVVDDGQGLPGGFDLDAVVGLGMQVVRGTARQLGGTVEAWTDGGAHFQLTIPLDQSTERA